jgi:DNA polymerase II
MAAGRGTRISRPAFWTDELVYTKRLRREPNAYEGTVPPQVRAARKRAVPDGASDVDYVVTIHGPEPLQQRTAPIDHAHYLEKQLGSACDVVLPFVGTSFAASRGPSKAIFSRWHSWCIKKGECPHPCTLHATW